MLTIQDLVRTALAEGDSVTKEKIAQESKTCEVCGKNPAMADSKMCKECAKKAQEGEDTETEKTSSERVQKLANAVEYIANNIGKTGQDGTQLPVDGPVTATMPKDLVGSSVKHKIPPKPSLEAGANPNAASASVETNVNETPPENQKVKSAVSLLRQLLNKKAAEQQLPEDRPSPPQPAETTAQANKLIGSNEAAINFTKRDAKAVPKKQLGEYLTEPAQSKAGDPTLQKVLNSTAEQAGAKIAAAKDLVTKLASQGCTCNDSSCAFCKLVERIGQQRG